MTLDDKLRTSLAELPDEPTSFSLEVNDWTATLGVERRDVLGCLLSEVSLCRPTPITIDATQWAAGLIERVTGLLEPLKLHEIESARHLTLLRSEAPTPRGEARQYYEIELHGLMELRLRRYQGFTEPGKKREPIAFALTYEGLAKLLNDLVG